jgi:hypothetical protein
MNPSYVASALAMSLALAFPAHADAGKSAVVQEAPLRAHLAFLSSDLLEGRGTGQRGGDLTVAYLEAQAQALGLKPGNGNSFRQPVQIAGVKTQPAESTLKLEAGGKALDIAFGKDWVFAPGDATAAHSFNAELVFVGYGITAPDEQWNDFKGMDLKGKVLVMMVNDPQPTAEQPNRFNGKGLTYYGRWTYKFEEAQRQGAAGVLLIHTTPTASYGWSVIQNSWAGVERFQLAAGTLGTPLQGWITDDTARALFTAAGQDLDALRAAAEKKDFKPVTLAAKLNGEMKAEVRKVEQFNVAAVVPGTDPKLKDEVVIYSAHWDHLGKQGDKRRRFSTARWTTPPARPRCWRWPSRRAVPGQAQPDVPVGGGGRAGPAGQRSLRFVAAVAAGENRRQPEPGQPELHRHHARYRHPGQRAHRTGQAGRNGGQSHGHAHRRRQAGPGGRLLPQRPLQLRQERRAGVLDQLGPRLRERSGRRESQAASLRQALPPGR